MISMFRRRAATPTSPGEGAAARSSAPPDGRVNEAGVSPRSAPLPCGSFLALTILVVTGAASFLGVLWAVGYFAPDPAPPARAFVTATSSTTTTGVTSPEKSSPPMSHPWEQLPDEHEVALGVLAAIPTTTTTVAPVLAPPVAEVRPSPDPAPTPTVQGGDSITEFLRCTRAHESDTAGGYQAVSPSGAHRGAYQFVQSTWDTVARWVGRPDLVGVPPDQASPADQDLLAAELYRREGNRHWGGRC